MGRITARRHRTILYRAILGLSVVSAGLACQRDQVTGPGRTRPRIIDSDARASAALSRIDSVRRVMPAKRPRSNELNMCFVITKRAPGKARFARDTIVLPTQPGSADTSTTGVPFFYVEFDPATKKTTKQVYCTLRRGGEALVRALDEFTPVGAEEALRRKRDARRVNLGQGTRLPVVIPGYTNVANEEHSNQSQEDAPVDTARMDGLTDASPAAATITPAATAPNAGVNWYCWDEDYGDLTCDWGEGEEYCYAIYVAMPAPPKVDGGPIYVASVSASIASILNDWWECGDGCFIYWDGSYFWRECECPDGYYWDDWDWECYWDGEMFELDVSSSGDGSGSVYSDIGGISCDIISGSPEGSCSDYYMSTAEVALSASAWEGNTFSGWSGACGGTGDCYVAMSDVRSVVASFEEQPAVFALRCSAPGLNPSTSISVVRLATVNCAPVRVSGPTSATATVTGWEFVPSGGSNTFGLQNVPGGAAPSWSGPIVARGTVNADVTIGGNPQTLSAVISNVTMRLGYPAMTAQRLYQAPDVVNFHTPAQQGQPFLAGEVTNAVFDSNGDIAAVLISVPHGPNAGYQYTTNSFLVHSMTVRINENEFAAGSNLHNMAGTPPAWPSAPPASPPFTAAWCTQNWIANSMLAQTELHEGTTTQTDSHTWARREYLTSTQVGASTIRERFEKFVIDENAPVDATVVDYIISPLNLSVHSNSHTHSAAIMQQCRPLIR